ncbi:hypothetical protein [Paraburkholderia xenovorans]
MQEFRLLTIEHGRRVIEAQYSEGRLAGFVTRVKHNDKIALFGLREWLGDLLLHAAEALYNHHMHGSLKLEIVNVDDLVEGFCGSEDEGNGLAVDDAGKSMPVGAEHARTFDIHFDLRGVVLKPGKKVRLYIPSKP